jgi:hypothetical protein
MLDETFNVKEEETEEEEEQWVEWVEWASGVSEWVSEW